MDVWWLCRGSIARGGKIRDISVHFFARHCFAARPTLHGFPLWLSPDDAIGGGAWGRMAARPSVDHSTTCPTTSQCPQPTQWLSPQSFPGLTQTAPVGLGYSTLSVWGVPHCRSGVNTPTVCGSGVLPSKHRCRGMGPEKHSPESPSAVVSTNHDVFLSYFSFCGRC